MLGNMASRLCVWYYERRGCATPGGVSDDISRSLVYATSTVINLTGNGYDSEREREREYQFRLVLFICICRHACVVTYVCGNAYTIVQ